MTNKEAIDVLQDVRAYLTSLESAVVNEGLASHSYVEICQAITRITIATQDENEVGDVLDKIRAEIGRCKTQHEMQIAERDTKSKLLISDIFCDVIEIIDKYSGVRE